MCTQMRVCACPTGVTMRRVCACDYRGSVRGEMVRVYVAQGD